MKWEQNKCAQPNPYRCYRIMEKYFIQSTSILCQKNIVTPPTAIPPTFATQKKEKNTQEKIKILLEYVVGIVGIIISLFYEF